MVPGESDEELGFLDVPLILNRNLNRRFCESDWITSPGSQT